MSIIARPCGQGLKEGIGCPWAYVWLKRRHTNYRPVSNLPVVSKIFEKLTLTRLLSFVNKYSILSNSQFGFRKGKNITQAAMKLTTTIVNAYHDKLYVSCFFLDLRKEFNTTGHEILLRKMSHQGFREQISHYLRSCLTGCEQYVQIGDDKSECLNNN